MGWEKYVGPEGAVVSIERFGASAPGGDVLKNLGISVDNVVEQALALVKQ